MPQAFDEIGRNTELNSFDDVLQRFKAAIGRLENWGIRIALNSRLRAYARRLEDVGGDNLPVPTEIAMQLLFDLREIDEITEIVEQFRSRPYPVALDKLRQMVSGGEHPDGEHQSPARDIQYELYLHSLFAKSPAKPLLGEPDLLVTWRGSQFSLEAKRPKSEKSFDDNLRKAAGQLNEGNQPGIIAISLDQILRPSGGFLSVRWPELMIEAPHSLIEMFLEQHRRVLEKRTHGKKVSAILFTARIPAQVASTGHASLATGIHILPIPGDEHAQIASDLLIAMVRASQPLDKRSLGQIGRNSLCPCGSGSKYKACHGAPGR